MPVKPVPDLIGERESRLPVHHIPRMPVSTGMTPNSPRALAVIPAQPVPDLIGERESRPPVHHIPWMPASAGMTPNNPGGALAVLPAEEDRHYRDGPSTKKRR
jgi:hypothetical protein